ncbi:MAG: hypothetical protein A4E29_01044 [Methanomassiliicoccales archaeon PtaB.Bin134]|nr:MAG: hypothetical protein A4E29_01044 [Methanomassiliicoccales archaeon PtaB.Bin134]
MALSRIWRWPPLSISENILDTETRVASKSSRSCRRRRASSISVRSVRVTTYPFSGSPEMKEETLISRSMTSPSFLFQRVLVQLTPFTSRGPYTSRPTRSYSLWSS